MGMHVILQHMDAIITRNKSDNINKDFILWSISFDKKLQRHIGSWVKEDDTEFQDKIKCYFDFSTVTGWR